MANPGKDDSTTGGGPRAGTGLSFETRVTYRDLGLTPFAQKLGLTVDQTNGHWCSRCEGIWFGYTLEAECPVCGNRKG